MYRKYKRQVEEIHFICVEGIYIGKLWNVLGLSFESQDWVGQLIRRVVKADVAGVGALAEARHLLLDPVWQAVAGADHVQEAGHGHPLHFPPPSTPVSAGLWGGRAVIIRALRVVPCLH